MRERGTGTIYKRSNSRFWWIAYHSNGRQYHESAGLTKKEARKKLKSRLAKIECRQFVKPKDEKLTVNQLIDAHLVSLELKGAASLGTSKSHAVPIREEFGDLRALNLDASMIQKYQRRRLAEGYAKASVNRGLQLLRAALNLAVKQNRLVRAPYVPLLDESDNVRQGFFEAEEYEAIIAALPPDVADVVRFGYLSGWRKGEIVSLKWNAVDLEAREVRLATSKNGRPRTLPLDGPLWGLIERRFSVRRFQPSDLVFGNVGDFRNAWQTACVKARLGRWLDRDGNPVEKEYLEDGRRARYVGKLFHDLRRTAARDMIRAGVDRAVAKSITGHLTDSMFDRYNITATADQRKALRQTDGYRQRADNGEN